MAVHLRTRPTMRLMRKSRRRGLMTEVGWKTRCTLLGALSLLAACTSTVPEAEFADVSDLVADRTGETIMWEPTTDIAPDVDARVETLLSEDLTAESAVQIALLNNPGLRATYAVGIGRADLVQAGFCAIRNSMPCSASPRGRTVVNVGWNVYDSDLATSRRIEPEYAGAGIDRPTRR